MMLGLRLHRLLLYPLLLYPSRPSTRVYCYLVSVTRDAMMLGLHRLLLAVGDAPVGKWRTQTVVMTGWMGT